ncbi:MAG: tetratricopeptide repeat protein [Bradymonadia bacterium]
MSRWCWSWVVLAWLPLVASAQKAAPDSDALDAGLTAPVSPLPDADVVDRKALLKDFDNAFRNLARDKNKRALRLYKAGDYPGALRAIRQAYKAAPEDPEILNNAGYLHHRLGDLKAAERYYRLALKASPKRYVAHINLVDLLLERPSTPKRLDEVARLLQKARGIKGNFPDVIRRQARVADLQGRTEEARRFYRELSKASPLEDGDRKEIADFHRSLGEEDEALRWYKEIVAGQRGGPAYEAARQAVREIEVERTARRFGWSGPDDEIPVQTRGLVEQATRMIGQGRVEDARRLLDEALSQAPQYAKAWSELGALRVAAGEVKAGEMALLRAMSIEQGDAEVHARLGRLYLSIPERAGEARLFLGRALDARPDWIELNLSMARACRAAGRLPRALAHVERYLEGGGTQRERAQALKAELLRVLPDGVDQPLEPGPASDPVDRSVIATLKAARAMLSQGRPDEALVALQQLPEEDRGAEVLNLEALILVSAERWAEAILPLERALTLDDARPETHALMGQVLWKLDRPEDARTAWARARARGSVDAALSLARVALEEAPDAWGPVGDLRGLGALLEARAHLKDVLSAGASEWSVQEAEQLKGTVDGRLTRLAIWGAGLVMLLGVGIFGWRRRIWGGTDLATLITEHPETGPDVQRVLSAVRHEVLKHNTMVLTGLVSALEAGQPAGDKARHVCHSLFGTRRGDEGVYGRLKLYAEQLRQIGRAHKLRLNLRRRDPAFKALLTGFEQLSRVSADLVRVEALAPKRRDDVIRQLNRAVPQLNEIGYGEIRRLLDQLKVLTVDEGLLEDIFERTVREPGFSEAVVGPLHLDVHAPLPIGVCIPRGPFEDILANLIRNALQSGMRHGQGHDPGEGSTPVALSIGLGVEVEVDMITGIERVVFLIRDRSPQTLTTQMLQGRFIEEGLGLTGEQVSRYEGTLDVRVPDGDWEKAVVVKLPRVYAEEEEGFDEDLFEGSLM